MILGDDNFLKEQIRGKSSDEILGVIREYQKIKQDLIKSLECDIYVIDDIVDTKKIEEIAVLRQYISVAKIEYEKTGGVYEPDNAEKEDEALFHAVSIHFSEGAAFGILDSSHIDFDGDALRVRKSTHYYKTNNTVEKHPNCGDMTKQGFLEKLYGLHIGEWDKKYINPGVFDGTEWNLVFTLEDGSELAYSGRNLYPYNYPALRKLMFM